MAASPRHEIRQLVVYVHAVALGLLRSSWPKGPRCRSCHSVLWPLRQALPKAPLHASLRAHHWARKLGMVSVI
jgi:hypothetical protein